MSLETLFSRIPPSSSLLLFDDECLFCQSLVQWLLRHNTKADLYFCTLQSTLGAKLYRQHNLDPEDLQTFVLITQHQSYLRSDAVCQLCTHLAPPWSVFKLARFIPKALRDMAYRVLAKNRQQWFGTATTCLIMDSTLKARFISE